MPVQSLWAYFHSLNPFNMAVPCLSDPGPDRDHDARSCTNALVENALPHAPHLQSDMACRPHPRNTTGNEGSHPCHPQNKNRSNTGRAVGPCSMLQVSLSSSELMLMTLRPELVPEYLLCLSALSNLSHCFPEIPEHFR